MSLGLIVIVEKVDAGDGQRIVADVPLGPNYPTDGEPITARVLGFRVGSRLSALETAHEGLNAFEYQQDTDPKQKHKGKLKVWEVSAGSLQEVPNGTDLTGVVVRVTAFGR